MESQKDHEQEEGMRKGQVLGTIEEMYSGGGYLEE